MTTNVMAPEKISQRTGREGNRQPKRSGHAERNNGRWTRGVSGNPRGRPVGSGNRNHAQLLLLLNARADGVINRVIAAAENGDIGAAKLVLDRVLPKRVCRPVPGFELPTLASSSDAIQAMGAITAAAMSGVLTTTEAADLAALVEHFQRVLSAAEIEARLSVLESRLEERQ